MRQGLDEQLSLRQLAAAAGLSRTHFVAAFRRAAGVPPMRFFHRLRIARACELLETSDVPVGPIATAVGYRDYRYFDRMFRRVVGQTPRDYRRVNSGWHASDAGNTPPAAGA
jgi:AraC family transcriptional regulator of arabinose operon